MIKIIYDTCWWDAFQCLSTDLATTTSAIENNTTEDCAQMPYDPEFWAVFRQEPYI
jgi:hypothetical protein